MREFKYGFRMSRSGVVWTFLGLRVWSTECELCPLKDSAQHSVVAGGRWRESAGVVVTSRCQWPV